MERQTADGCYNFAACFASTFSQLYYVEAFLSACTNVCRSRRAPRTRGSASGAGARLQSHLETRGQEILKMEEARRATLADGGCDCNITARFAFAPPGFAVGSQAVGFLSGLFGTRNENVRPGPAHTQPRTVRVSRFTALFLVFLQKTFPFPPPSGLV